MFLKIKPVVMAVGINLLSHLDVSLAGERKASKASGIYGETRQHDIGVRIPAVVSITLHDALEGNVCAACQHGIGVQILRDVSVSLHDAPKDNCCEKTLAQTSAMLDVVNSHAVQGPRAFRSDLVVEACGFLNKRTRSAREDTVSQSNWKKDRL